MCVTVHGVSLHSLELGPLICKEDRVRFYRGTHHGREVVLKVSNTAKPLQLPRKLPLLTRCHAPVYYRRYCP